MGLTSSNPAIAALHGRATWVIVSPTFTSAALLMPVITYPTSPQPISSEGISFIFSRPTSSTSYSLPVAKNFTLSPLRMLPFFILT